MATVCAFQHDQHFMISGNCFVRKELLQLYKRIQDEQFESLDTTKAQMLIIYNELIEKFSNELNHFCKDVNTKSLKNSGNNAKSHTAWCIGQGHDSFKTLNQELEIIKDSLNRYLHK